MITYWNAFVAVLELMAWELFSTSVSNNTNKFPIAATARFGHISVDPDSDLVTSNLPALHKTLKCCRCCGWGQPRSVHWQLKVDNANGVRLKLDANGIDPKFKRQRRQSYQPRATPWGHGLKSEP